ncbi:MAG: inorganic diphosphatase [Chloroflexi bacterium]|nr:inorganic diphosphatase [Chloroflexota bacterium]
MVKNIKERDAEAIIEIPKGHRNKYEIDIETGKIRLDRVLYSSIHYPSDYGFISNTLAEDGDALDVIVMMEEPTFPGCHIDIRIIGVLVMKDEKGLDEKVLAVPIADPRYKDVHDITDVRRHHLVEIEHFFQTYKELEDKSSTVIGWQDAEAAKELHQKYSLLG